MKNPAAGIIDRREAILHTINVAREGDIVLVAGKGHEEYQLLSEGRVPFSDYKVIDEGLEAWSPEYGKGH